MKVTLQPTTSMHIVSPNAPGDAVFGRLWVGTDELGYEVQAVIVGVALHPDRERIIRLIPVQPITTPEGTKLQFDERLICPPVPIDETLPIDKLD